MISLPDDQIVEANSQSNRDLTITELTVSEYGLVGLPKSIRSERE